MNDLQTALWWVLALYSTTATRKLLDYHQNAFFGKISRDKWVNSCEASGTVLFSQPFNLSFCRNCYFKGSSLEWMYTFEQDSEDKKRWLVMFSLTAIFHRCIHVPSDPCQINGWHLWLLLIQLHGNATGNWVTPIPQWHPWSEEIQKSPPLGLDTLSRHNFGHNALVRASSILTTFFSIMWMVMKKH